MLVIKGAFYECGDELVVPTRTGLYSGVDCALWKTKGKVLEHYDKQLSCEILKDENRAFFNGEVFYHTGEIGLRWTKGFNLLSDLSYLNHQEGEYDF